MKRKKLVRWKDRERDRYIEREIETEREQIKGEKKRNTTEVIIVYELDSLVPFVLSTEPVPNDNFTVKKDKRFHLAFSFHPLFNSQIGTVTKNFKSELKAQVKQNFLRRQIYQIKCREKRIKFSFAFVPRAFHLCSVLLSPA